MKCSYKFKLKKIGSQGIGFLVPLELLEELTLEEKCIFSQEYNESGSNDISLVTWAKRIFYSYGVSIENSRGAHAYYNTEQILICIAGSLKIRCFDGEYEAVYILDKPDEALYIGPKIWRTTFEHSSDSVLLVLSSLKYNEEDYIRDYEKFMEVVSCT